MMDEEGCYEDTYDEIADCICFLFNELQEPIEDIYLWEHKCSLHKLKYLIKKIKNYKKQYTIFDLGD